MEISFQLFREAGVFLLLNKIIKASIVVDKEPVSLYFNSNFVVYIML